VLQLDNTSPYAAQIFALCDRNGVETLVVVVKGTFTIGSPLAVAREQQPVVLADEYRDDPATTSLARAAEGHLPKPGTDVVVVGEACAPREREVTTLDVGVGIRDRLVQAHVSGERYWTEGVGGVQPSRPRPFVRIPVTYERAFGGSHVPDASKPIYLAEPTNPVGRGFRGKRSVDEMLGQPVPNIDDPRNPLRALGERPTPVGFGPVAPSWKPRVDFAGTYDEVWRKTRAPYLPRDFDPRFFNIAPPPLSFPVPLQGGDRVALIGFHPSGTQRFALPRCRLDVVVTLAGSDLHPQLQLDTVVLEPTDERFSLVWRAAVPVDKKLLRVERVRVSLEELEGAEREPTA
jgi:hypothetical protein